MSLAKCTVNVSGRKVDIFPDEARSLSDIVMSEARKLNLASEIDIKIAPLKNAHGTYEFTDSTSNYAKIEIHDASFLQFETKDLKLLCAHELRHHYDHERVQELNSFYSKKKEFLVDSNTLEKYFVMNLRSEGFADFCVNPAIDDICDTLFDLGNSFLELFSEIEEGDLYSISADEYYEALFGNELSYKYNNLVYELGQAMFTTIAYSRSDGRNVVTPKQHKEILEEYREKSYQEFFDDFYHATEVLNIDFKVSQDKINKILEYDVSIID